MAHSLSRLLHRDSEKNIGKLGMERQESIPNQALLAGAAMKPDEGHLPATYNLSARRKSEIHDTLAPEQVNGLKDLASRPKIQVGHLGTGDSKMGSRLNLVEAGLLGAP
jgi:hypothetical protein